LASKSLPQTSPSANRRRRRLKESEQRLPPVIRDFTRLHHAVGQTRKISCCQSRNGNKSGVPLEDLIGKTVFQVMPREIAELRLANIRRSWTRGALKFSRMRELEDTSPHGCPLTTSNGKKGRPGHYERYHPAQASRGSPQTV